MSIVLDIIARPDLHTIGAVKSVARRHPERAQEMLLREYASPYGPRWTLIQWLKRHRLHNPTTRTIPNP